MPRPRQPRRVARLPEVTCFEPRGGASASDPEVRMSVEGLEAIRLVDLEGLATEDAARRMGVSRHTFGRVLADARQSAAEALALGRRLRIEGGHWTLEANPSPLPHRLRKELVMNRIAISSQGPGLDAAVDPHFGRAPGFVLVDVDTLEHRFLDNAAAQARAHGAGIAAAQSVADAGASVVITGRAGPKAHRALGAAGIQVEETLTAGARVRDAVARFKSAHSEPGDAR